MTTELDYKGVTDPVPATLLEQVKRAHETSLMALPGVVGVGIGPGDLGEPAILDYVTDAAVAKQLPRLLDGIAVKAEISGEFDALSALKYRPQK